MKNLILFDIDDTLINTKLLKKLQMETLANTLGVSSQEIENFRLIYLNNLKRTSDFSTNDYLQQLANYYNFSFLDLKRTFWHPINFQKCLFPESVEILSKLEKEKYQLGIYSEGFTDFQKHKLKVNNLLKFFAPQHTHILRRKMDPKVLESLPKGTIIIDDKPSVINYLKKLSNIIPIHIIRDNKYQSNKNNENVISGFTELIPLLDQLSKPL
ncbi:MAG: HAD hydrolase-like protein [Candidatus Pacebacteria bacterium]|jgi:phosphoglycolate phosphatase-like HAD superfamily hydrolase|nr:HAD hydrolase-like protein [Candidatus Paceibacterota bacterium]MBT4652193.1 HAD hydrolase-like protein [Candidatus Paceibacterota bacterium]MBT6756624.1 HAD hydrolase-like protein [Candidatus Paceibacterota bacterium]MBT6920874.1 HAD hydrolase-like protein [Candidatus Paceibacterota bacterium]